MQQLAQQKHAAVDLILAAEETRLYPRHLILGFDAEGRFELTARLGGVSLDGEELRVNAYRMLRQTHILDVGPLRYCFQFIVAREQEEEFLRRKTEFWTEFATQEPPNDLTSATPSMLDIFLGDWTRNEVNFARRIVDLCELDFNQVKKRRVLDLWVIDLTQVRKRRTLHPWILNFTRSRFRTTTGAAMSLAFLVTNGSGQYARHIAGEVRKLRERLSSSQDGSSHDHLCIEPHEPSTRWSEGGRS
ncbi:hypothetical protein LTR91_025137 [Friedmanniomyces endolithicus]|uniref:Uncharacterized protein n=1 Tax=Friedmanniomyces endolithicus TaxID=329885 RepID=A0AAN6GZP1_9PEZI|nr:hypothetical protein LTR94_010226 [Friedmanniomyces endolithicus]KAK0773847.1 hypothetical protein LTR38_016425 [Friedmanniomyces endolithicus]KAK0792970.1 hypothetical protein LTR59_008342 [Friedmanniomyces endolithicus]KAK0802513.1 hypothetical protein LTR75_008288 [Friedmanniomyces endolithicus]KAK0837572.1 hypothetical protein LTR03_012686 [Friedmanniomyces endolithicus]